MLAYQTITVGGSSRHRRVGPWDVESPSYYEDLRQWQEARSKTRQEAMPE